MALSTGATQAAVIAKYRGDTTLQGLLVGSSAPAWNIFDAGAIRTGQTFPYLEVFTITGKLGTGFSAGGDANDIFLQVAAFTRYGGMKQARDIMTQVYALTHGPIAGPLTIPGFTNFLTLFDTEIEQGIRGGDGITEQIAHRYLVMNAG